MSRYLRSPVELVLSLTLIGSIYAQGGEKSARDLFYTVPETPAASWNFGAKNPLLGLRYAILKLDPRAQYTAVPPGTTFRAKDEIRLEITANQKSYLYVVARGSSGNWLLLFPNCEIKGGNDLLEAGEPYQIPGHPGESFVLDEQPGEERIFLMLARTRVSELDEIAARQETSDAAEPAQAAMPSSLSNDALERLRQQVQTRDLVFTNTTDRDKEKAVYVVNRAAASGPGNRIVVDLKLNHR